MKTATKNKINSNNESKGNEHKQQQIIKITS